MSRSVPDSSVSRCRRPVRLAQRQPDRLTASGRSAVELVKPQPHEGVRRRQQPLPGPALAHSDQLVAIGSLTRLEVLVVGRYRGKGARGHRPHGHAQGRPVSRDRPTLKPAGPRHPWPDEISTDWGKAARHRWSRSSRAWRCRDAPHLIARQVVHRRGVGPRRLLCVAMGGEWERRDRGARSLKCQSRIIATDRVADPCRTPIQLPDLPRTELAVGPLCNDPLSVLDGR